MNGGFPKALSWYCQREWKGCDLAVVVSNAYMYQLYSTLLEGHPYVRGGGLAAHLQGKEAMPPRASRRSSPVRKGYERNGKEESTHHLPLLRPDQRQAAAGAGGGGLGGVHGTGTASTWTALPRRSPHIDALIIGGRKPPGGGHGQCRKLKLICKHGAGLDNIDLPAAKAQGVIVTNAPGTNSNAVADLTFGLMLSCARRISAAERGVRRGEWKTVIGHDVYGKTLGIMGFGAIGKCVARRPRASP